MEFRFGYITLCCWNMNVARWLDFAGIMHSLAFVDNHGGETTLPKVLTNERMVDVSPCSKDTCWNVLIFFIPRTFISLGTFWTPVSSPNQIYTGETIPTSIYIFFKISNHWLITVGFAPIARAIDRFLAFFNVIVGVPGQKPIQPFSASSLFTITETC